MPELTRDPVTGGRLWRAKDAIEREAFEAEWCNRCAEPEGRRCLILSITRGAFHTAWRIEDGRQVCTAFRSKDGSAPRCALTADLFQGEKERSDAA